MPGIAPRRGSLFAAGRVKFRQLLPALLVAGVVAARAASPAAPPAQTIALRSTAGNPIQFDYATKEMVVTGGARLVYGDAILTADEIRYNDQTGIAHVRGQVTITRGQLRLLADEGTYTVADGHARLVNVRIGHNPYYLQGRTLEGTAAKFTLTDATLTYGEPGGFAPVVRAESIDYVPGQYYEAHHARLLLGGIPLFAASSYTQRLDRAAPLEASVRAGYHSALGPYVDVTLLTPLAPGLGVGGRVGLYGNRGVLAGPAARYDLRAVDAGYTGELRTGWIHDLGSSSTRRTRLHRLAEPGDVRQPLHAPEPARLVGRLRGRARVRSRTVQP